MSRAIQLGISVLCNSGLSEDELPTVIGMGITDGYDETNKTHTITPHQGECI